MSTRSRYIRSSRNKLTKKIRSKEVLGSFEDANRWYRCWNCGFILDITITQTDGKSGNVFTDFSFERDLFESVSAKQLTIDSVSNGTILFANFPTQPDGTAIPEYVPRKSQAVRGCPLCGTTNLP